MSKYYFLPAQVSSGSVSFADFGSVEKHGIGKHQWDVPLSEIPIILKVSKYKRFSGTQQAHLR